MHSHDLRRRTLRTIGWVSSRIGVVAVLQILYLGVMVRLLDRTAFGEISIVVATLMICELFTQTGIDVALMREQSSVKRLLDAAWSVQVVRGLVLALLVMGVAGPLGTWQGSSRLTMLLMVSSGVPILDALQSKGVVLLGRGLLQRGLTVAEIVVAATSVVSGVALALWLRSPWALLWNLLLLSVLRTFSTYLVHPHRPRFTLGWGVLRPYARYGLFYNLATGCSYLLVSLDRFVLGRLVGLDLLGLYDRVMQLSSYGVNQLPKFLAATAYPSLASVLSEPVRLERLVRRYVRTAIALCVALAVGVMLLAGPLVRVLFGDRFTEGIPLLNVLSVFVLCRGLTICLHLLLDLFGRAGARLTANLVSLAVLVPGLFLGIATTGLIGAAGAVALASAVGLGVTVVLVRSTLRSAAQFDPPTHPPAHPPVADSSRVPVAGCETPAEAAP